MEKPRTGGTKRSIRGRDELRDRRERAVPVVGKARAQAHRRRVRALAPDRLLVDLREIVLGRSRRTAKSFDRERALGEGIRHRRNPSPLRWRGVSKASAAVRRPRVRMLLHGAFRGFAGGAREVALDAANLGEALEALVHAHPSLAERLRDEHGKLRPHMALFVNEDDARLLGWEDAPLKEGDIVHVIPALSGG